MASRASVIRKGLKNTKNKKEVDWAKIRDICVGTLGLTADLLRMTPYAKQGAILSQAVGITRQHLLSKTENLAWLFKNRKLLETQLKSIGDPEIRSQVEEQLMKLNEVIEGVTNDNEESDEDDTV